MATNEELEERIISLHQDHARLFGMTLELIEATLELSQAARMQNDEPMRSKGEEAFKAVSRAIDQMKADKNG
ncbi:hypothetical protein [Halomonas sp. Mc5H-6]|uniref:hypothetical protein n=1 Tax=Halomonas sp. Mc5H-6 TaxID=2954500 RepID=UPI0020981D0A|nr:hypothetical protein [Halomonas sp. Mc5H-6]MCO7245263.1 hypothetical protein [Halomonas sp. Mc5H-6]